MKLDRKWIWPTVAVGACVGGYALGRYVAPNKVVTHEVTRVETVTKVDTQAQERVKELTAQLDTLQRHTHTEKTVKPDGTKTTVTDTTVDRSVDTHKDTTADAEQKQTSQTSTVREVTKTVEVSRARPDWRVGALVGFDINSKAFSYGATVERRILGPLSVGAWGLSNGVGGISLTLEF
jgi:hypothetical protein